MKSRDCKRIIIAVLVILAVFGIHTQSAANQADPETPSEILKEEDFALIESNIEQEEQQISALPQDLYADTVTFSDLTGSSYQLRDISLNAGLINVLAYVQYADMSREYPNTLAAITSVGTNFSVTELNNYTQLEVLLPGNHVLLIPEQEKSVLSQLESIGAAWSTILQDFVSSGGIVVQCDYNKLYGILTGAGLMNIVSSTDFVDESVTIVAPGSPIVQGISGPYNAQSGSSFYNTAEGQVVVERTGFGPVVIHKMIGSGHVVLIGHDYFNSNADQDRIVGNAVLNLPILHYDLLVTPSEGFESSGEQGGPFTPGCKTYTLINDSPNSLDWTATSTQAWLDVTPAGGMLAGGASTTVDVCINANANMLPEAVYTDSVTFSNLTNDVNQTRDVQLIIGLTCCPSVISSYPYCESFESDFGDWNNTPTGDDFDWTRHSGSTGSSNTGPSSAYDGNFYLYTEASGYNYMTAILEGPCFDLRTDWSPVLSFWYHMYGSDMGTLSVEVTDDCINWSTIWTLSGNQNNIWHEAVVDLYDYIGSVIKIRFKGTTGGSYRSDMAIDKVCVDLTVPKSEIEVTDSIPPVDDLNMPFGEVFAGFQLKEQVTITNMDPAIDLVVTEITLLETLFEGFNEEFPSTTLNPENWTNTSGAPTIDDVGLGEPSSPYSLRLNGHPSGGDAVESRVIDLAGVSNVVLTYWYERTGGGEDPDSGEDLVIGYWSGSNWVELERQLGDGPDMTSYVKSVLTLPPGALHENFRLRISSTGTSDPVDIFDDWFVDDVSLTISEGPPPPLPPLPPMDEVAADAVLVPGFWLENVPELPLTIPPLGSVTIDVIFEPAEVKEYEGVIVIKSYDADEPEVNVQLTGAGMPDYLEVIPAEAFAFWGHPGGPFVPSNTSYQLTNNGPVDIDWAVEPNVPWLDIDPVSGTLKPAGSTTIVVTVNSQANTMPEGDHAGQIIFTNFTTSAKQTREVILEVHTDPKMWVRPGSFNVSIPQLGTHTEILTIGNTGDAALDFNILSRQTSFTPMTQKGSAGDSDDETDSVVSNVADYDFTVPANTDFTPGELLVRFGQRADAAELTIEQRDMVLADIGGAVIEREYSIVPGLCLVKLSDVITVEEALQQLGNAEGVLYAQPNYKVWALSILPDDPMFGELWGMHNTGQTGGTADADIDAPEAWEVATGTDSVIVAVIDTGVDYTHPDLAANMWINEAEFNGTAGVDDDGNGYVDDIYGYDCCNNDPDPLDDEGHGSHVSGTIGAVGNNGVGVTGVCWNVRIMAVKFLNETGSGSTSDAIESVQYATLMGAQVMSNSWGGGAYSKSLEDAIKAAGDAGILFVAAAGNGHGVNNDINPHYPSSYDLDNVIAVLSTDYHDDLSDHSNYGPISVDIGAPGGDPDCEICSCYMGGGYYCAYGTSMATPHVSGACALIWSISPSLTRQEVKDTILRTADPLPSLAGRCVSNGRLNLHNAVLETRASWVEFMPVTGTIASGQAKDVTVTFNAYEPVGTYQGEIIILSSDPYTPEITIPMTLTVEPVDHFTQLFAPDYPVEPNDPGCNDMANCTLTFWPDGSGGYRKVCSNEAVDFPVDPDGGTVLPLRDDDYIPVKLKDAKVNFYGTDYDTLYVGSNGYITFSSGDLSHIESLTDHFNMPRISPLFDDLDPSAGGLISWKQLDDRVVVTFENVPEYSLSNANSFQIEIRFNGKIRITFLKIAAQDGLVGLSDGCGLSPYFVQNDLSECDLCTFLCDLNGDQDVTLSDFALFAACWLRQHDSPYRETVRDEFKTVSYTGNDGTRNWSSGWKELGETDGPDSGLLQVLTSGTMRIGHENIKDLPAMSLTREADLHRATTAVLTYDYMTDQGNNDGSVSVQVSGDGGANWDTLVTYPYNAGSGSANFDITSYISSNTQVRFELGHQTKIKMYLYVDNVQIGYDDPERPWYPWCNGADFTHDFSINSNDLMVFIEHWLE